MLYRISRSIFLFILFFFFVEIFRFGSTSDVVDEVTGWPAVADAGGVASGRASFFFLFSFFFGGTFPPIFVG